MRTPFRIKTDARALAAYILVAVLFAILLSAVPSDAPADCQHGHAVGYGDHGHVTYCVRGE